MEVPTSNASFYHLGLSPTMLKTLDQMKIVTPTPIQQKAIPVVLEGNDLVGVAQTGTGKTLAFGVPSIQRLAAVGKGNMLVVVPTRELAAQVEDAMKKIFNAFHMPSVVLVGGLPMHRQVNKLRRKPRIVVATPGRLIDHLERRTLSLNEVSILVLDEADRMFDMGFAPQIERVMKSIPTDRQTLLFSATMPKAVINLATKYMKLPMHIEIAPEGTTAENVSQEVFIVKDEDKEKLLSVLLNQYRGSVLLFVRTRVQAKKMTRKVKMLGHTVGEIHSDRSMGQRRQAIEGFKSGKCRVLVATDVAARGLDVSMIELVVNYDLPDDIENYVHRIGRTGRAGDQGHAVTFAKPGEGLEVSRIEKMIRKPLSIGDHPEITQKEFVRESRSSGGSRHRRSRGRSGGQGGSFRGRREGASGNPGGSSRSSKGKSNASSHSTFSRNKPGKKKDGYKGSRHKKGARLVDRQR